MLKQFRQAIRRRMEGESKEPKVSFVDVVDQVLADGAASCGLAGNAETIVAVVSLQDEPFGLILLSKDGYAVATVLEAIESLVADQGGFQSRSHMSPSGGPATMSKLFGTTKPLRGNRRAKSDRQ